MEYSQYIGIDLHKAFFQVCVLQRDGTRRWEGRFATTVAGIGQLAAREIAGSLLAVEATGPTWRFVDAVTPLVARVVVVDTRKTRLKAGYAAKTDRLDARRLADAVRRDSVVGIYVPPPAIRELRELTRYHRTLVRTSVALKQRIHALLLRQQLGVPPVSDLFGKQGRAWLATVTLEGQAGVALTGLRTLWADVARREATVRRDVQRVAATDPAVQALQPIPGIGPVLGLVLRAEAGDPGRFPTGAALACYAGVVPRVSQSAGRGRPGRLTKAGSPALRWALIEAGIHAPRRRDRVGRWTRRLALRKNALTARAAAARRLCDEVVAAWHGMRASSHGGVTRTDDASAACVDAMCD
jgi:transposase